MHEPLPSQRAKVLAHLQSAGMARLSDLMAIGATAATVSRLEREGSIIRLARGLYQLPDASIDTHHSLAELAKLVPKGVICLTSALSFHGLTDQIPAKVWMAIGPKDWRPRLTYPPARFVHFPQARLAAGVEQHLIEGVSVPVFGVAGTLADLFRHRRTVGINVAIEGLRNALAQRTVPVAEIAQQAADAKIWNTMEPYVRALTSDA